MNGFSQIKVLEPIFLWPEDHEAIEAEKGPEAVRINEPTGDHVISNVHNPTLTPYLPSELVAGSTAIIIAPGGGHRELWIDHEGYNPAKWLADNGVATFVLKYRLAKEENSSYTVDDHAVADMHRAIQWVRKNASQWNINPDKVGVMGFSAGGEVAAMSDLIDYNNPEIENDDLMSFASKPNFQILIYPGNAHRYEIVENSSPAFIACGFNDREDIALGMADLYSKYWKLGIPAELHIYALADHGFGVREANRGAHTKWMERVYDWMVDMKYLQTEIVLYEEK